MKNYFVYIVAVCGKLNLKRTKLNCVNMYILSKISHKTLSFLSTSTYVVMSNSESSNFFTPCIFLTYSTFFHFKLAKKKTFFI